MVESWWGGNLTNAQLRKRFLLCLDSILEIYHNWAIDGITRLATISIYSLFRVIFLFQSFSSKNTHWVQSKTQTIGFVIPSFISKPQCNVCGIAYDELCSSSIMDKLNCSRQELLLNPVFFGNRSLWRNSASCEYGFLRIQSFEVLANVEPSQNHFSAGNDEEYRRK